MTESTDGSAAWGRGTAPTIAAFLLALLHSACTNPQGPDAGDGPRSIVSGTGSQSAPVTKALPKPLVARVLDKDLHSLPNITVIWTVDAEGGSVSPLTSVTNNQGLATTTWTMGTKAGAFHARATTAKLQGKSEAIYTATAVASLASVSGTSWLLRRYLGDPADTAIIITGVKQER